MGEANRRRTKGWGSRTLKRPKTPEEWIKGLLALFGDSLDGLERMNNLTTACNAASAGTVEEAREAVRSILPKHGLDPVKLSADQIDGLALFALIPPLQLRAPDGRTLDSQLRDAAGLIEDGT